MRPLVLLTALACATPACGKDRSRCQADVIDLTRYMQSFDLTTGPYVRPARLVTRAVTEPAPNDLVLVIAPVGARFGGEPVTPDTLGDALARRTAGGRSVLVFAIDEAMPWSEIVPFLQASADAGIARAAFAFEPPSSGEPPPRTEVDERIDRVAALSEPREAALEASIRTTFQACKPVVRLLEMTNAAANANPGEIVMGGIGTGLLDCECQGVDFARARSIAWHLFHRPGARVLGVALAKDGKPLAYPGGTPWQQIGPQLAAGAAVWPAVAP